MGQVVATPIPAPTGSPPPAAGSSLSAAVDAPAARDLSTAGRPPEPEAEVELALEHAQPHWRLHWVVDGERRPAIPLAAGPTTHRLRVPIARHTFVRAEIWDTTRTPTGDQLQNTAPSPVPEADERAGSQVGDTASFGGHSDPTGRCIALTNPIWYVPIAEVALLTGRSTDTTGQAPGELWAPTLAAHA
jgi:hypothetical protein